ncbi:sensor histidine kinase [Edaphobacter sp.]|uniref:sensor histidine kinase n=1 Tax=Edaphobacter sp. TaxID=1934404 RepID=UPI002DBC34C5|nr:two-component regulator propeller domain-containing protein [Edaphobacter sp.]HEU5341186.1 two-component regulator propeller domain-containing protein [Edaphobacter sp.]
MRQHASKQIPASFARLASAALLCAITFTAPALPQNLANLGHQTWTTENGLPQNSVHQIFQSRDGYIWLATEGGIARFNGVDFRAFTQEDTPAFTTDDICCFAEDTHGNLWIGTAGGLLQYHDGMFRHFTLGDESAGVEALAVANGDSLYALTGNGIAVFNGKSFAPLPLPSSISPIAIAAADNGSLWLATATQTFQFTPGNLHPIALNPAPTDPIEDIGSLPGNGLWLLTGNSLTLVEGGHTRTLLAGRELPQARLQSFLEDTAGNLWVGTGSGLFVMEKGANRARIQPALGTNSILSLFEDSEGDLWAGTGTAGLDIFRRQSFRTLPALSDHVTTAIVQSTDGAIWAGTNGDGLDRWQAGTVRHYSAANGLLSDIILAVAPGRDGSTWVGTPDGLDHIAGSKIDAYTSADGLPDDFIRSLLVAEDGSLWIGTRRGLAHWQDNAFTTYTQANGLGSNLIGALIEARPAAAPGDARPDLWIGTLDGLSRLRAGKITTYTTKDGLSGNIITSLLEDREGTLWIGTKGSGLTRATTSGFLSLNRPGLPRAIDSILEDNRGNLWLSSTRGITRVPRAALLACGQSSQCDPHAETYGRSDGMPTEEASAIGHPAAWKDALGQLWFATRKGVAIADPDHLAENRLPPPVAIERFTVDDAEVPLAPTEINIEPGHTRFAFDYAGLSFAHPSRVRYRYILEGFDKQWTEAGPRRSAYYTNLPPRHYRFRVEAASGNGEWNEAGAALAFYVHPAFYRRVWFILLCLALLAGIIVLLYRLRVRRLRRQFDAVLAERNRMAREIHDTLAQSFVGVSVQLELASQLLAQSQPSAAQQQIDRTRTYVREGLAEARRSIWDLRAITAHDTLPSRLTHLVEQTGSAELHVDLTIGGTYRPLAPAVETEVLRIAQESLANVARHAQATRAAMDLRYHSKHLALTVTDNGRGFEATADSLPANGHFGLQGMRERAAQIGAHLEVASTPGQGTAITLDVPIAAEKGNRRHGESHPPAGRR